MFSQWATKRVGKFLIKRLLGRMLRSELDFEQLEVQLGFGTIQLRDLFLNTDYLNDQLGDATVAIREGSISSIKVKIPWKVLIAESCEIEVDELKLVVVPQLRIDDGSSNTQAPVSDEFKNHSHLDPVNDSDGGALGTGLGVGYIGVDDGVRMVAKMVERVLLGLRVRVTNLIIAFDEQVQTTDTCSFGNVNNLSRRKQPTVPPCLLIVRVASVEYGVEAPNLDLVESLEAASGPEPSMLVKVVKFKGATVEVVEAQDESTDSESLTEDTAGAPLPDFVGQPTFILVGDNGGLGGSVQLSVPLQGGSTNVPKVHADVVFGLVKLNLSAVHIEKLLSFFQAFVPEGGVSNGGPGSVPSVQASMPFGVLGNPIANSFMTVDTISEAQKTSMLSKSGRVEADSSNGAFLPATKVISDWLQWAGSEGQRKDTAAMEADLAASVDEFFECLDGTRSNFGSFSSSGMWSWTRSALSAITTASNLAAGSIILPLDPPKQLEYCMQARVHGISLDLYYDCTRLENFSILPTQASELYPLKEITTEQRGDFGDSITHKSKDSESPTEECLTAELFDLNVSMLVSGGQTEISVTIADMHLSELVRKDIFEESRTDLGSSSQSQLLQSCVENALPTFPVSLAEDESRVESFIHTMNIQGKNVVYQQGPRGYPFGHMMARAEKYDKNLILHIRSEPVSAAKLKFTWKTASQSTGGNTQKVEFVAFLQPLTLWLDVRSLKRMEVLLERVRFSPAVKKKSSGSRYYTPNSSLAEGIHLFDQAQTFAGEKGKVGTANGTAAERGPFEAKIFAPSVRVIACFPSDVEQGCSGLQKYFMALDLSAPPSKWVDEPILEYKHQAENEPTSSTKGVDILQLKIGHIVASLITSSDEDHWGRKAVKSFNFTTDEILIISHDSARTVSVDSDLECGASVEFQWRAGSKVSSWIAKRAWDGVMAQQSQGDGWHGIGGSNSEFAAATTAAEAAEVDNSQLRMDLLSCSSSVVHVNVSHAEFSLSEPQYTLILELLSSFISNLRFQADQPDEQLERVVTAAVLPKSKTSDCPKPISQSHVIPQTSVLVQCGHVDVNLHMQIKDAPSGNPKQGSKVFDVIRLNLKKLQVLSVLGIGGTANSSYLWAHHEDSEIVGSYLLEFSDVSHGNREMLLLSCKREALGRGDGGGGNALAAGKAGLTVTHMVWPGQEQLGDALLTGTMRGITVIAHSGRLDWLSAVLDFFNQGHQMEESVQRNAQSGGEEPHDSIGASVILRTFFLLDLHDFVLCYEPGTEASVVRTERASKQGTTLPSESSQIVAPVACVVAAAALRVSSSVVPKVAGEEYKIWLRDVAINLLDTALRKDAAFDYTTESMHSAGYVQIAKEAVMAALVRIDCENGLQWEVECANNQLRFDTCHDTTAAFGRLVAQLQQLFAPEIELPSSHANSWNIDGRSSSDDSLSSSSKMTSLAGEEQNSNTIPTPVNLFEGVLEDAFSHVRSSWSSASGGDVGETHEETTFSVRNGSSDGKVVSLARVEFVSTSKQGTSHTDTKSVPRTPTQSLHQTSGTSCQESVAVGNTGLPSFIEDYYVMMKKHASYPPGVLLSMQNGDSPVQSARSRNASSSAGREAESKGGWYAGNNLEVVEDHVPKATGRVIAEQSTQKPSVNNEYHNRKMSQQRKYPSSVGRLILKDLSARWRLYGGSDWPIEKGSQDQKSPSEFIPEEFGRQSGVCLEVLLDGMDLRYDAFPAVGLYASRLVVTIRDISIYDCSNDAPWKMVLGYHRTKAQPRESSSRAVKVEMDSVRPDPTAPLEEYRLAVSLLPIRLHLDQRHIDFCIEFFTPRGSSSSGGPSLEDGNYPLSGAVLPGNVELISDTIELAEDALLPFFQICDVRPFTISVDYLPRRVDLSSIKGGNYAELLNLVTWKGIELNLKHVKASGVHGWSSLSGVVFGEWLEDIAKNQVHKFVRGVGPIRPLFAVGSGAAKLLVIPAAYYKKDRRLFRGMQKGAIAFVRSVSVEALGLGAHLAATAQEILQQTELALGGPPTPTSFTSEKGERRSKAIQPGDTREGLQQACESISYGLERTASSLVGNPFKAYQRGAGAGLAIASALRAAPAATVAPVSAAAAAIHRALLGVRNGLDPEKKRESDEKHTGPPPDTRRIQ